MNTPPVWVLISQAAQAVRGRYSSAPGASMPEKSVPKHHKRVLLISTPLVGKVEYNENSIEAEKAVCF